MNFKLKKEKFYRIAVSPKESLAVQIAIANLKTDLYKVLYSDGETTQLVKEADIIIGTLGVSEIVAPFVSQKKLSDEKGNLRKEAYYIGVQDGKLVVAGSDRRGTIYGIYEICEWMGVSPWYFWADVPVKEKQELILDTGYEKIDYPSVEYRGIFINDEEELESWVQKHMGEDTIGVKTYEKVFELLLRLKGNYIWPAMHVNSFNAVPANGALADKMGIVVGTSHCDMLMRSNNREWGPWIAKKGYINASYDYSIPGRNRDILKEYWKESVEQNKDFEVCYTLGMRGIHDSGFETKELMGRSPEEIRKAKVDLLTHIIQDQKKILSDTLGHDTMMTFIPYKEVLELYDNGLEIPEDLTLVWANDNYGYIRRYPDDKDKIRKGGNGIYYHNSYWAPPSMSYVFLCSIPLAHTKNELQKAYQEGIRKLWVINTGSMKPLEQEITFFLRLGWEIGKEHALTNDVDAYVEDWINRTFTGHMGKEVASLLNDFSQLTNVRKIENMSQDSFSQTAYGDEAVVRIHKYEELFKKGNALYESIPAIEKAAFFQMVLMRIHAAYFTNLQYYYGDRSTLMLKEGKMQAAAYYTQKSREFDDVRRKMLLYYNKIMVNGKWDGMVDPEGFPPPRAAMMPVCTPPLSIGKRGMVVNTWNNEESISFVRSGTKWLEIGNCGEGSFVFEIQAPEWVTLSEQSGEVATEKRILVTVKDTIKACDGRIIIHDLTDQTELDIAVKVCPVQTLCEQVEEDGMVVVSADAAIDLETEKSGFQIIKRLGRGEGDLVEAKIKQEIIEGQGTKGLSSISYKVYLTNTGTSQIEVHRFPSLNSTGRIRIGISVDDKALHVVETLATDEWRGNWKENVRNNVDRLYMELPILEAGEHTITFYPIDKYFAFSRFVIYTKKRIDNNFPGIKGNQALPRVWDTQKWCESFYGEITLKPRAVAYAQPKEEKDDLAKTVLIKCDEQYSGTVEPEHYISQGSSLFKEEKGAIKIDAASALAQSPYAYFNNELWQYCSSESYGRSGLAMYVREPGLSFQETQKAPALHYKLQCSGGEYVMWLLCKFDSREESFYGIGVDGKILPEDILYEKERGCLWRYEAEQIYRWVPLVTVSLTKGDHEIALYAKASGLRFDRIYLTKVEKLPPTDYEW